MPDDNLERLQDESDAWKRMLNFLIEENIYLKNRVAVILKNCFNKDLLETIEDYQTRFLKEDVRISLLRNDLSEYDKLITREIFEDRAIINEVKRWQKKLHNNITNATKQFKKLQLEFNYFLSENM
jgi:cell wall assembly regulator SMI1